MFSGWFRPYWSWFPRFIAAISEGSIGMIVKIILVIWILFVGWKIIVPNEWGKWRPPAEIGGDHRFTFSHTLRPGNIFLLNSLCLTRIDNNRGQTLSLCCQICENFFSLPTSFFPPSKYFIFLLFLGNEVEMVAVILSDQVPLWVFAEELQEDGHTQPLHPELSVNCSLVRSYRAEPVLIVSADPGRLPLNCASRLNTEHCLLSAIPLALAHTSETWAVWVSCLILCRNLS